MKYNSQNIGETLQKLNHKYFLPAIQREFIWKPEQVIALFDSILRGYPIGSFLFWKLKDTSKEKWQAYRFITNANDSGTHNESAALDSIQEPILILDGQQRLTSLLIGLTGHYMIKKKYARRNDPNSFKQCKLYIDLLHDPATEAENKDSRSQMYYRLAFRHELPSNTLDEYWYPVGKALQYSNRDAFTDHHFKECEKLPESCTRSQEKTFKKNLDKLYNAIWNDDLIAYYTENEQDYDRVLDIFVRSNEGGTKLSKSDILMSLVTAKWNQFDARDEINTFLDYLNRGMKEINKLSKDFILKSSLVLTDLPVGFKAENFTDNNLNKIENSWLSIKESIKRGIQLANSFGINSDTMTSANALIPLIYFCHQHPKMDFMRGTLTAERTTADIMRRWLITAMMLRIFSGSSDNLLKDIRSVLQRNPIESFPVKEISDIARKSGPRNPFRFDEETATDLVQSTWYGNSRTKLILSITHEEDISRSGSVEVDHIFPKSKITKKALKEAGIGDERIDEIYSWKNLLGNLQLLSPQENREKSDKSFDDWIRTRDDSFLHSHAIPDDESLWCLENFEQFLEARENILISRLTNLFKTSSK